MKTDSGLLVHGSPQTESLKTLPGSRDGGRVLVTEGRPLLLGARRTAPELLAHGLKPTLISDNMVARCMQRGMVSVAVIGYWEAAPDGLTCPNGALGVAICAAYHDVPVYALPDENRVSAKAGDLLGFLGHRVAAMNVEPWVPAEDRVPWRWVSRLYDREGNPMQPTEEMNL